MSSQTPLDAVDDLPEAAEVDRDEVVHREPRQRADRLQRPRRAAFGVRLVDPAPVGRLAGARDVDDQVAREREQRDRLGVRVGTHEHDGVGAGLLRCIRPFPLVVADDERSRRLVRERDVELLLGDHDVGRRRDEVLDALLEEEVVAASDRAGRHQQRDEHPGDDGADDRPDAAAGGLGLPVDRDRRQRTGRQHRMAVAVDGRPAAYASLQRRPHTSRRTLPAPAREPGYPTDWTIRLPRRARPRARRRRTRSPPACRR